MHALLQLGTLDYGNWKKLIIGGNQDYNIMEKEEEGWRMNVE